MLLHKEDETVQDGEDGVRPGPFAEVGPAHHRPEVDALPDILHDPCAAAPAEVAATYQQLEEEGHECPRRHDTVGHGEDEDVVREHHLHDLVGAQDTAVVPPILQTCLEEHERHGRSRTV